MKPNIGSIVLLTLSATMAALINGRRTDRASIFERIQQKVWPLGAQAHIGNVVAEGDVFPVIVVRAWGDNCISGQAVLDGNDTFWVPSIGRNQSIEPTPGCWEVPVAEVAEVSTTAVNVVELAASVLGDTAAATVGTPVTA